MRQALLVVLLVAGLGVPGLAAAAPPVLPVQNFTISSTGLASGTGALGGVQGAVTSAGGMWSMTVDGVPFAMGTYSCNTSGCSYTGTVVGSSIAFSFRTSVTGTATSVTGFSTHGAWVSTVAHWANTFLSAAQIGKVVSDAARIEGLLASGDRGHDDRPASMGMKRP